MAKKISIENYLDKGSSVKKKGVFLGGTCNGSNWRNQLQPLLKVDSYNPVTTNWSMETQQMEEEAKRESALNLFVITPKQTGFYSFAELMLKALKDPKGTVVTFLDDDDGSIWNETDKLSVQATEKLLKDETGVQVFNTLAETADYINNQANGSDDSSE